jgi:diadenosine tetraphosphate (Ap4A) HIT family hydrolase
MSEQFKLHSQLQQDCFELAELPLCKLLLCNDSNYPWFILVPRIANTQDIYQLAWQVQQQLLNESSMLSEILMQTFAGDKINIATLGNVVPQLHLHHIVRFKSDVCWPKPVWGQHALAPYSVKELQILKEKLLPQLDKILN